MSLGRARLDRAWTPGSIFQGGYEIVGEVGAGSFGTVHEARQLSTGQRVAIKVLRVDRAEVSSEGDRTRERFQREMRLCVKLAHPHIVPLIDSGESDAGLLYAVFQFVPGVTLKEVLAGEGKLSPAEAVHLMAQVLDALSCAHAAGVVHRDLKPENIMVMRTGVRRNAMVLDFGLAGFVREAAGDEPSRLTASPDLMGTPCYAAPEQLRGGPPSVRCDIYSWGLILLECLTGEMAVTGASAQEVVYRQLGPEPVAIPPWLRAHRLGPVLAAATQKQEAKRDAAIADLLGAMSAVAAEESLPAIPPANELRGQRRQLTVLYCRLEATSTTGAAVDLEDADEVVQLHQETCVRLAGGAGGQPAGFLADGAAFVFGYPRAREDDARRAARAALEITAETARASERLASERGLHLNAHIGIHTGVVVVHPPRRAAGGGLERLVGVTPTIAAALARRAAAGEVLASHETLHLLHGECVVEEAVELDLGEPAPRVAHRLHQHARQRRGRESLAARQETPLIGRRRPLEDLRQLWKLVDGGGVAAALLRGEPGIGKSRLLRELRRVVPADAWVQTRCLEENQGSPLRPFADLLAGLDEPVADLLLRHGFDLDQTLPLFAALLGWPDDRYVAPAATPERQRERTLDALLLLLLRMAETRPLVLAVEDLHWADATTLEFLGLLVRQLRVLSAAGDSRPRLCAAFTARPEFEPPWSGDDVTLMQLARLDEREVVEMIGASLAPDGRLQPGVIDEVVRHADGIPLFVEEVARALAGTPGEGRTAQFSVPSTLRDLLTARLDLLAVELRETAQLAALLGREFRYEVLRAVSSKEEADLRSDLAALQTSGLLFHRRSVRSESWVFKHALVRDAAYDSLTRSTRQRLHQRVANTLRHRFPDFERNRPEILAHHFEHGGQLETAVEYLHRAGSQALHRAAYRESLGLLDRALSLSRASSDSPARRRQEVQLLSTIGSVLVLTHSYAAPEVEETFRRALAECTELGSDIPTPVLFGIWGVAITRSDRAAVEALLPRFREIVEGSADPVALVTAQCALGCAGYWKGDFADAERAFDEGRALFGSAEFQRYAQTYGYGAGLYAFAFGMLNLWCLGFADRADAVRRELFRIAELARDPYVSAITLGLAVTLAHDRDTPEVELELADRLASLLVEQKLPLYQATAAVGRGGALLRRGHVDEALPLLQQGIEGFRSIGTLCSYNFFLLYLADAHLQAGRPRDALAVIDQGRGLCSSLFARLHEPELFRLEGQAHWQERNPEAAEASLRSALTLARERQAKAYELRAACDLARLLRDVGRGDEARAGLDSVFAWFTEGFETPDLITARALLAEL